MLCQLHIESLSPPVAIAQATILVGFLSFQISDMPLAHGAGFLPKKNCQLNMIDARDIAYGLRVAMKVGRACDSLIRYLFGAEQTCGSAN